MGKTISATLMAFLIILIPFPVMAEWAPPTGIPKPDFGIGEEIPSRPDPWTSEVPGYYYIDNILGSDSGNTYGTPFNPRKTIPNPIPAGSYIEVHGNYSSAAGGIIWIYGEGTNESWEANIKGPIWIIGVNSSFLYKTLVYGKYIYLNSIEFYETTLQIGSQSTPRPADHIFVNNCAIHGDEISRKTGLIITGSEDGPVTNILFYNNSIYGFGNMSTTTDQDAGISTISDHVSQIWILENNFYNCTAGLRAGGGYGYDNSHHIYVGRNNVYNILQSGLAVKYGSDIIFSENNVHDIIDTPWSPSKCIGFQYGTSRLWIINNELHNCYNGVRSGSDSGNDSVYIIGNIIYNANIEDTSSYGQTEGAGIQINGGASKRYIIGNTIYNVEKGIDNAYYRAKLVISNNIISNTSYADVFLASGYGSGASSNISSTLFDIPAKISWGDNVIRNLSDFKETYNKCEKCIEGNPLFIDPINNNFNLHKESSAIDKGILSDVYQKFYDLYGININIDRNNISRPQGSGWDIGAYEYVPEKECQPGDSFVRINSTAIKACSCNQTDVQAAVDAANDGDTVIVPEGECVWNRTLYLRKTIELLGKGKSTVITNNKTSSYYPLIFFIGDSNESFRFSNFSVTGTLYNNGAYGIEIDGSGTFRIDHCLFINGTKISNIIAVRGDTYGVIDHCEFIDTGRELISVKASGKGETSWSHSMDYFLGTPYSVFVEDCYFNNTLNGLHTHVMTSIRGGNYVFRNNTVFSFPGAYDIIDVHGYCFENARGGHVYEIYNNTFVYDNNNNYWYPFNLRGGGGVIFNNIFKGKYNFGQMLLQNYRSYTNCTAVYPVNCYDSSIGGEGYPCKDQIQDLYIWNNTVNGNSIKVSVRNLGYNQEHIQQDRDFFLHEKPDYTPYIYPHPLTVAPFGTEICGEGQITGQCWCQGMRDSGYCCHGYYQTGQCSVCRRADINCDNKIDINELVVFIHKWLDDKTDMQTLIEAIIWWKKHEN